MHRKGSDAILDIYGNRSQTTYTGFVSLQSGDRFATY